MLAVRLVPLNRPLFVVTNTSAMSVIPGDTALLGPGRLTHSQKRNTVTCPESLGGVICERTEGVHINSRVSM